MLRPHFMPRKRSPAALEKESLNSYQRTPRGTVTAITPKRERGPSLSFANFAAKREWRDCVRIFANVFVVVGRSIITARVRRLAPRDRL
jgi:hypothetical protein